MATTKDKTLNRGPLSKLRALTSSILSRTKFARVAGLTYEGKRDMYTALGYRWDLTPQDYRQRYYRNAVAGRIVETLPKATWRGEVQLVEDDNPDTETTFELQWKDFDRRIHLWSMLSRADILSGIGRYAIILIGAPDDMAEPLEKLSNLEDIKYLSVFGEEDAQISLWDEDVLSPRFGLPLLYTISRPLPNSTRGAAASRSVHWTRTLHIADGLLDDRVYGRPRLERVWNLLDDLEKITGGGAEAYWKNAHPGYQIDVDPELEMDGTAVTEMEAQIDEYEHNIRRWLQTSGMTLNPLGAEPPAMAEQTDAIITQISAGTGIPKRILTGSERGNLASSQDRQNWNERVEDRRQEYAEPFIVRAFVTHMETLGAVKEIDYEVRWPGVRNLDEKERATVVTMLATANSKMANRLISPDELRDLYLDLEPLDETEILADPLAVPIEEEEEEEEEDESGNKKKEVDVEDVLDASNLPRAAKRRLTVAEKKSLRMTRRRRAINEALSRGKTYTRPQTSTEIDSPGLQH